MMNKTDHSFMVTFRQAEGLTNNVTFRGQHKLHRNDRGFYCYHNGEGWRPFEDDSHYINTVHDKGSRVAFFKKC